MPKGFRNLALNQELLLLLFLFFSSSSFAQNSEASEKPSGRQILKLPSASRASIFGEVRFESLNYLSALDEAKKLTNSQFLSGRISVTSFSKDPGVINGELDISAGTFFSLKQSYYSLREFYASTYLNEVSQISLGRKKHQWSEIDRIWEFGLWQPRYNIDALRPEDNGLTGLFFDYQAEKFQLLVFGSTLFIPTVGPEIREEDGQLVADNRWYRPPSNQVDNISLSYKLEIGNILDLVSQESYALHMRFGEQEKGPWLALAGGRKPINDIAFERLVRGVSANSEAEFVVGPRVTHHLIFSTDVGYQFENGKVSFSYFEDQPESLLPPPDFAVQKFEPIRIYTTQMEYSTKDFLNRTLLLQAAYLKTYGGGIQDIDSEGRDDEITLFTSRYRFSDALRFNLLGELTSIYSRPLVTKFGFTRDFEQKGSIMSLELQYQWNRDWSYLAGFDALSVDENQSRDDGFINSFRANDRIYAGAAYVF